MSQLTAHIAKGIYDALPEDEKDTFLRLIDADKKKRKQPKKKTKSIYDNMPAKFHPDNQEMLIAELMHST